MVMSADKFTRQAQEALQRSQQLVRNYQHSQWDVEHVLLALVALEEGLPERILRELGVDPEVVKGWLHQMLDRAPKVVSGSQQIFITPRLQRMLQIANEEAESACTTSSSAWNTCWWLPHGRIPATRPACSGSWASTRK